jgi:predicted DNA binding protein
MSVVATIAIDADAFELGEVLNTQYDLRIDLTQFVPIDGTPAPYFWVEDDGTDAFAAAVRSDPRVKELTAINGVAGRTLYRVEWNEGLNGFLSALGAHEIIVERGIGIGSTWVFQLRSANREALSEFQNECITQDVAIEIRRVFDDPDETDTNRFDLTTKQHEAVMLALDNGYFDVPREASLTELAKKVGISRQAYSRRLNRGLQSLLTNTVGDKEMIENLRRPDP